MSDTSPAAQAVQDEIHRRMSGEEKLKLAMEMSDMVRNFALARQRTEHPDWTDWELKRELPRLGTLAAAPPLTTQDLFRRVLGALEAAGIPVMLTGSVASSYHGAPRATQNVDLVIAPTGDR